MCGLFGLIGTADAPLGEHIAHILRHRGPDDHGVYTSEAGTPLTLTSTRLAIIDLSPAGHMPMLSADGKLALAFNGEIYNFQALRQQLEIHGHHFRSDTDTEVILAGYRQWGDAVLDRLRGMWALLLWDVDAQRLLAARDRLGIKPVYYARRGPELILASELKALLATGRIAPDVDPVALQHYLAFYSVPAPHTMLRDVHALPPGHKLIWQAGAVTTEAFWQLPVAQPSSRAWPDLRDELRQHLEDAIRLRMIADVPVGAFLSGGIDSSAIVGLMTRVSGKPLRTFSIGFDTEGAAIDERSYARIVAERYGAQHTEVIVRGDTLAAKLPRIVEAIDQPSGDALNSYLVAEATAQHVTVALSGVGGDELFAGYPQYRMLQQAARLEPGWQLIPGPLREQLACQPGRVGRIARYANADLVGRYMRLRTLFDPDTQAALLTNAAPGLTARWLAGLVDPAEPDIVSQVARLELGNYMPNTLLRDVDAMSMAHSLEVRVPLIDHVLVEFVRTIPARYALRGRTTKWLLIEALRDVLPPEVITRPKRGFEMPVAAWMRGPLRPAVEDALSAGSIRRRGLLNETAVAHIRDDFYQGRNPVYLRPWTLAIFELWARRYLDTPWTRP